MFTYVSPNFVAMYFMLQLSTNWPHGILKIFVLKKSLTTIRNQVPESAVLLQKLPIVPSDSLQTKWGEISSQGVFYSYALMAPPKKLCIRFKLETLL